MDLIDAETEGQRRIALRTAGVGKIDLFATVSPLDLVTTVTIKSGHHPITL